MMLLLAWSRDLDREGTLEHDDNDHDGESEVGDEYARVSQCVSLMK